jgi:hypothetical protein
MRNLLAIPIGLLVILTSCTPDRPSEVEATGTSIRPTTSQPESGLQRFPDVVTATATPRDDGTFDFTITISSPYDSPDRYADAWRVLAPDGTVFGIRELLHDHAAEQPFTRSLEGVKIPPNITTVTVEGRDLINGWGGRTVEIVLPDS